MEFIQLQVQRRDSKGTTASRRLRAEGKIPAVLYGLGRPNADLTIDNEALEGFLHTGSKLVELTLGDLKQQAILREVTHDPLTDETLHVDLVRIDEHHEIEAGVEVQFKGLAKGTLDGGLFEAVLTEVAVRCTPAKLPKAIVVDITALVVGSAIMVKDLPLPAGVKVLHHKPEDHVCHVVTPKVVVLEPTTAEAGPAEPERIGGKKPEEGAEAEAAAGGKAAAAPAKKDEKKDAKK